MGRARLTRRLHPALDALEVANGTPMKSETEGGDEECLSEGTGTTSTVHGDHLPLPHHAVLHSPGDGGRDSVRKRVQGWQLERERHHG